MSDESFATIKTVRRAVVKSHSQGKYIVCRWEVGTGWVQEPETKGYTHSTSAYAKLGRITTVDSHKDL